MVQTEIRSLRWLTTTVDPIRCPMRKTSIRITPWIPLTVILNTASPFKRICKWDHIPLLPMYGSIIMWNLPMAIERLHVGCNSKFLLYQNTMTTPVYAPILKQSTICQICVPYALWECGLRALLIQLSFDLEHWIWFVAIGGDIPNRSTRRKSVALTPVLTWVPWIS